VCEFSFVRWLVAVANASVGFYGVEVGVNGFYFLPNDFNVGINRTVKAFVWRCPNHLHQLFARVNP